MNILNKIKKGQSLPLNAIVIAVLVIIVLLVIILFFTGSIGKSSADLNHQRDSAIACSDSNPLLSVTYAKLNPKTVAKGATLNCSDSEELISLIPTKKDANGKQTFCCGTKK